MKKVLFILNHAPNYRAVFLRELAKHIDLTVMARGGDEIDLRDPDKHAGYRFIELKSRRFMGLNFNISHFTQAFGDFDILIFGASLREPFMLLNLLRPNKKIILFGHIFSHKRKEEFLLNKILNAWAWRCCNSFLVHSDSIKNRLAPKTDKPVYSFNNTYFYESDIKKLPFFDTEDGLHIIWVGRYVEQEIKLRNITCLIDLARRNKRVSVRLIGTGIRKGLKDEDIPDNVDLFGEVFDDEVLERHFRWSHVVMNPGIAGLLVVNTARFGRPIIIDENIVQGPEVQLARDADQIFLDFDDNEKVDELIDYLIENKKGQLEIMGGRMADTMKDRYTIEYMVQQFLKAIDHS